MFSAEFFGFLAGGFGEQFYLFNAPKALKENAGRASIGPLDLWFAKDLRIVTARHTFTTTASEGL